MRIAFLADPLDRQYGGIHVYTKELLQNLCAVDAQNEYIIVRAQKGQYDFAGHEEIVVPYQNWPGYRAWRIIVELPRLLRKKKVDLVVEPAHFGPFNLPKHIRRITVIHDMTMFLFPEDHVFFSQFVQRKVLSRILKKADHIITNSANSSEDICRIFPFAEQKTTPVLLGKSPVFSPQKSQTVLAQYGIKKPFLLCTATLEPRKNIAMLVQAFGQFKEKTKLPHQLVLVGKTGWKAASILHAIQDSTYRDDILLTGYVAEKELPTLYSATELFIYPSKYEGFGLPVLEAMACAAPVLISEVSSLPEVGGSAAHYFPSDSVDGLSKKMIDLWSDTALLKESKRRSLEQAARFSWEKTARETIAVFERVCHQKPK